LKIPITKRVGRVAQGEGPEFKPQYRKTKPKNPHELKAERETGIVVHACNPMYFGG
jgi:hypothetical protein